LKGQGISKERGGSHKNPIGQFGVKKYGMCDRGNKKDPPGGQNLEGVAKYSKEKQRGRRRPAAF